MFDWMPNWARGALWQLKHAAVEWLFRRGQVESFEVALAHQLKGLRITHVLDVGANRGQFARRVRRLGYAGEIVSFEPVSACYEELSRHAKNDGHWTAHKLALGDCTTVRTINVARLDVMSSILEPNADSFALLPDEGEVVQTEEIHVRQLGELLPDIVPFEQWGRTHLKLDTQGYDLRVLCGLGRALQSINSLQAELSVIPIYEGQQDYVTSLAFLRESGFRPTCVYPIQRVAGGQVLEFDALFSRA